MCLQTLLTAKGTRGAVFTSLHPQAGKQASQPARRARALGRVAPCTSPQARGPAMFKSQERRRRLRGLRVDGAGRWRLKLSVVRAQLHSLITTGRVMALAVVEPEAVVGTVLVLEDGCELCLVLSAAA